LREIRDVMVSVAEVVNDPHIGHADLLEALDDRDFVVHHAEPAV